MRPLQGIRVLDLSRLIPGPFATLVLSDLGATVDKIEDPGSGDYLRHMPPSVAGASGAFHALNRGKRSLILDLKHPRGPALLLRLLAGYDVLFEQFRPGVLARLGLGHDLLRERFPRLLICSLTGYGQHGPLAHRAGHDLNYLARAGVLGFQGPPGAPPQVPGFQMADISGGLWSVVALLAALRERDRTGQGAVLDVAMVDGVLGFSSFSLGALFAGQPPARGEEPLGGAIAPYNTYLSSDGHPLTLAALEPKFWAAFCAGVGIEPDMTALFPGPHQQALKSKLADLFATHPRSHWEHFAAQHDCCLEPALAPHELRSDPHLNARKLFFSTEIDGVNVENFRTPVTPSIEEHRPGPAPASGEHTGPILAEAGLSPEEIAELRSGGVVR
jgi:crotonobetainyl-CoA:carnitine CoA-transferase CaiB-like acyl-CoA transferase